MIWRLEMQNQYDIQQQNIDGRRSLLNALTQQSLTPQRGQMAGQVYVGPGLLDALSRPLQALAATYGNQQLDQQDMENAQAQKQSLQSDLAGLQGKTGQDFSTTALGSDNPLIQNIGEKSLLNAMAPKKPESFKLQTVAGPDGKPSFAQVGSYGTIKPVDGLNPYEAPQFVGGEAVIPSQAVPGQLYGRDPAPRINNQIQVTPQFMQGKEESQFGKTLGEKNATRVDAAQTVLDNQSTMQDLISRFKDLESQPMVRGGGANWAVKAAQFGSTFGIPVPEGISNAEQFQSLANGFISDRIAQGGRGFTDEDAKRLQNAVVDLTNSPEGATKVRKTLEDVNNRAVQRATQTLQIMGQRYPELQSPVGLKKSALGPTSTVAPSQQSAPAQQMPKAGDEMGGYIFQGGDPSSPNSWRPK
jgi:hypothetical protein